MRKLPIMTSRFAINGIAGVIGTQLETGPRPRGPMAEAGALFGRAGMAWDVALCLVTAASLARPDRRRVAALAFLWDGGAAALLDRDAPGDARALYQAAGVLRGAIHPGRMRPSSRAAMLRALEQAQAARRAP